MDILSSLATLVMIKEDLIFSHRNFNLLKLIDTNQIDYKTLFGSWAGAFGLTYAIHNKESCLRF